jgi:hypothetical protein
MPGPLREQALDSFTSGTADVLITTDASAEGLNLHTRCRTIVHAEVPASARTFLQRTGRVDRYGQSRRVHAFVFSSDTSEDQDASTRLEARRGDGERWLADVASATCRRTRIAQRLLAGVGAGMEASAVTPHGEARTPGRDDEARTLVCRVGPRRWLRFAARAGVPSTARRLSVALVRVRGGPPLSTCAIPVAIVDGGANDGMVADMTAHPSVATVIGRTSRLAGRLREWEREAQRAHARVMRDRREPPGLFDDTHADDGNRGSTGTQHRLRVTADVIGVLERRP